MKKVLSTVAALGLVAGLASTASAVEFKMSGMYMVEGAYLSSAQGTGVDVTETATESNPSDAYWLHTFEIKPTMQVNDKISMTSVIRLADDTFWGSQAGGDIGDHSGTNGIGGGTGDVEVWQLYMDYKSPIGKLSMGRMAAGSYGTPFRDYDGRANKIVLSPSFLADGPWSTMFYVQKTKENTVPGTANAVSDADTDAYVARLYYKTDNLNSGIHYGYTRNMTDSTFSVANGYAAGSTGSDVKHELTAYGMYKMDNYFVNGELTHFMGEVDLDQNDATHLDRDYDSWAGLLQIGGKFDALTASLAYMYAQGNDMNDTVTNGGDISNALGTSGTGDKFEPLYILTGRHTGILNNDLFSGNTAAASVAGVHAVVAAADYAVSNQLALHGAIGWAKADETQAVGQDDEYGWEYNIGAAYKLMDNLTYEAHFGYLDTGDFFNGAGNTPDITNNVYILTHSLTMTF